MNIDVMQTRPIDGHAQQGAAAMLDKGIFLDCPWPNGTLAGTEWKMGFLGMHIATEKLGDGHEKEALRSLLHERIALFTTVRAMLPSIEDCEGASRLSTAQWHGNDEKVARALHEQGLLQDVETRFGPLRVVKGAYWGPVSMNAPQAGASPTKAIWLEGPSGIVVDPFRWIAEATPPRLWAGNTDQHDPGGMKLRAILARTSNEQRIPPGPPQR